jgi:membrane protein insertase Oxa1/YidC/SpoIIIJ
VREKRVSPITLCPIFGYNLLHVIMKLTLEEKAKQAEINKYLAEAKKATVEQQKIQYELSELVKENSKRWYRKKETLNGISKWAVGISFITFFLNYVIVPAANKDKIELEIKNSKTSYSLMEREQQIKVDFEILKRLKDSLALQSVKINELNKLYNSLNDQLFAKGKHNLVDLSEKDYKAIVALLVKIHKSEVNVPITTSLGRQ